MRNTMKKFITSALIAGALLTGCKKKEVDERYFPVKVISENFQDFRSGSYIGKDCVWTLICADSTNNHIRNYNSDRSIERYSLLKAYGSVVNTGSTIWISENENKLPIIPSLLENKAEGEIK